jgi:hypothetical protein
MYKMRNSSLWSGVIFLILLGLLLIFREALQEAHITGTIEYLASDAATYFHAYEVLFLDVNLAEAPELLLIGSPILFMNLVNGNLLLIQLWQLGLMFISIKVGVGCFETIRGRVTFIVGTLIFPYFLFGFLSLNKEIYAMCATIFYASYYLHGKRSHLLVALILAMVSRYYMLISLVTLLLLVPRIGKPRYWLICTMLIVISVAAPFAKSIVPGYSSEGLLDAPSSIGLISSKIIDSFGYAIFYPVKYVILIPMRAYGFFVDPSRTTNAMEGLVSLVSLAMLILVLYLVLLKIQTRPIVGRFILLGFIAPMPIMWSEIMHWRYYSFVYFFFIFSIILHYVDQHRYPLSQQINANHA